ncbi:MAG: carboxynorspermidine decarboxylase [Paludibacteraceae bacterium]|nr:carboxynorspermidine decarboxylase [Paludibacteraceae bacterium]
MDYTKIPSPCYVMDERLLRANLSLIKSVAEQSGAEIIMAFKAFALWKSFPIVREYIPNTTASSLAEARLAFEEMGSKAHTYAPVYAPTEIDEILRYSSHITFNSLTQLQRFADKAKVADVKVGLRINPEFSVVETDLYNPCVPGSRLGILCADLPERLPDTVSGLHVHCLCESSAADTEHLIQAVETKFARYLNQIEWINFGGGHLMTREGYEVPRLVRAIQGFKARHPHLHVILEPGSAFAWRTGVLVSTVQDIVENSGVRTAMLDVSFACHMPDCLEMPYKPSIVGATDEVDGKPTYRMGGNSCLSGDFYGSWSFDKELQVGDRIVFEDMIHYTMVKTTMFNGVTHPSIAIMHSDGSFELCRKFGYADYKMRLS